MQVDSLLSRLDILQERISNTEHLVNLDLDSKRNALVRGVVCLQAWSEGWSALRAYLPAPPLLPAGMQAATAAVTCLNASARQDN